jgi:hypothetical protein
LACVGVDCAAVNLGQFKGLKALIQKKPGDARTDSNLKYWGWFGTTFYSHKSSTGAWNW